MRNKRSALNYFDDVSRFSSEEFSTPPIFSAEINDIFQEISNVEKRLMGFDVNDASRLTTVQLEEEMDIWRKRAFDSNALNRHYNRIQKDEENFKKSSERILTTLLAHFDTQLPEGFINDVAATATQDRQQAQRNYQAWKSAKIHVCQDDNFFQCLAFYWNVHAQQQQQQPLSTRKAALIVFPNLPQLYHYQTMAFMAQTIQFAHQRQSIFAYQQQQQQQDDADSTTTQQSKLYVFHPQYKNSPNLLSPHAPFPALGLLPPPSLPLQRLRQEQKQENKRRQQEQQKMQIPIQIQLEDGSNYTVATLHKKETTTDDDDDKVEPTSLRENYLNMQRDRLKELLQVSTPSSSTFTWAKGKTAVPAQNDDDNESIRSQIMSWAKEYSQIIWNAVESEDNQALQYFFPPPATTTDDNNDAMLQHWSICRDWATMTNDKMATGEFSEAKVYAQVWNDIGHHLSTEWPNDDTTTANEENNSSHSQENIVFVLAPTNDSEFPSVYQWKQCAITIAATLQKISSFQDNSKDSSTREEKQGQQYAVEMFHPHYYQPEDKEGFSIFRQSPYPMLQIIKLY